MTSPSIRPADHPQIAQGKIGVLLVNLGTPDGTDYWSMRRYLSEFLSDPRVVEVPQILWQLILQGPILAFRPSKSGKAYKKIWTEDGSPLLHYTRKQAQLLRQRIGNDKLIVEFAMRYGNPSLSSRIEILKSAGCERILIFPLYPQYSASTTASVCDKAFDTLKDMRWQPALRTAPAFYDDPGYIEALCDSLSDGLAALDFTPEVLLLSYHGIPKSYFDKGDPYHCHCQKTTRLVREKMHWSEKFCRTTFQSRFGPEEWLQPYTDVTLAELPEKGTRKIAVAAPAFISDCVETLEEIAIEGKQTFMEAGGTHFAALPCLNASRHAITMLETLVMRELGGWV